MHYKINDHEIKSHNAAKPHTLGSKEVINELKNICTKGPIMDFGCGKLRYSDHLIRLSSSVFFVDSRIQIERHQKIKDTHCSVKEYVAENYPSSKCSAVEDIRELEDKFEFIFCSNVLSAIPCEKTLDATMSSIHNLLSDTGKALIVNQHRSSYFKKFEQGKRHLHGYLYKGNKGSSYYGIIDKPTIENLSRKHGFSVNAFARGDRTFAYLTKSTNIRSENKKTQPNQTELEPIK